METEVLFRIIKLGHVGWYRDIICDILPNLWPLLLTEVAWKLQRIFWPALHVVWVRNARLVNGQGAGGVCSLCCNAKLFSHDLLFSHGLRVSFCAASGSVKWCALSFAVYCYLQQQMDHWEYSGCMANSFFFVLFGILKLYVTFHLLVCTQIILFLLLLLPPIPL